MLGRADVKPERVRERKGGEPGTETESLFFSLAKALADLKLLTVFSSDGKAINRKAYRCIFSIQGYIYISGSGGLGDKIRGFLIQDIKNPKQILLPLLWFS